MGRESIFPAGRMTPPPFITEEGIFDVTLVNRVWGKRTNLICVFQKEDGTLFSVTAWRRHAEEEFPECYTPRKTEIDFSYEKDNTRWRCEFKMSKNRKTTVWLTAERL